MNSTTVGTTPRLTVGMTRLSAAAAMCACLLLLPACGKVPGQFLILQDQVPDTTCAIPPDVGALYNGEGRLDIALVGMNGSRGYFVFPLMENNFPAPTSQSTDPNRIALSGFDVSLSFFTQPSGQPAVNDAVKGAFADIATDHPEYLDFQVPWSGTVDSGGGHTPGLVEAFPAKLAMDPRLSNALPKGAFVEIDATIRARGTQINGTVESDDFHFPIKVCNQCLVANAANLPACPVSGPIHTGNPCNFSQDGLVDCCMNNGTLVCPATTGSP
jgi:hypothetical protein